MELTSLLSNEKTNNTINTLYDAADFNQSSIPSYSSRHTMMATATTSDYDERLKTPPASHNEKRSNSTTPHTANMSPYGSPTPKSVAFELLFPESPQFRARLPMRVQIFPHDTTESIVTTVKNFYGLYAGPGGAKGVIFEDDQGNTLIARYENLRNDMVVYVRVIEDTSHIPSALGPPSYHSDSPILPTYYAGDAHNMLPPQPAQALNYGQPLSRSNSRNSRKRSMSPNSGRGRRSASASANIPPPKNPRSRSGYKSRGSSTHGSFADIHSDAMNGYSSGDGAPGSVSSRTKSEHLGNTEISLDNIVEGGRRKRAKFESSELPLFAPPQMPAATSNSSVSPARRMDYQRASFPFTHPAQHPFSNPQILQSPQSHSNGFGAPGMYANDARRTRATNSYTALRQAIATPGNGTTRVLPTPDPTVGSCMSEEDKDVALQLMRLGEMVNISHGRTSASTLDDTFSGRADAASSTGATSDAESESEDELPPPRRPKTEGSPHVGPSVVKKFGKHVDDNLHSQDTTDFSGNEGENEETQDGIFKLEGQESLDLEQLGKAKMQKARSLFQSLGRTSITTKPSKMGKPAKPSRSASSVKSKSKSTGPPISPTSLPSQSRKTSVASALNFQHQLGDDEEDLSSKPRCQRCRKSKKGCDRQRPCQRCKDAGLSADQCVSEDEGNGRKGRYGRHMGVPVKKEDLIASAALELSGFTTGSVGTAEKSKKRKR